ncbi:MAG: hypothetical protein R8M11_06030 [Gallionella sp.]
MIFISVKSGEAQTDPIDFDGRLLSCFSRRIETLGLRFKVGFFEWIIYLGQQ